MGSRACKRGRVCRSQIRRVRRRRWAWGQGARAVAGRRLYHRREGLGLQVEALVQQAGQGAPMQRWQGQHPRGRVGPQRLHRRQRQAALAVGDQHQDRGLGPIQQGQGQGGGLLGPVQIVDPQDAGGAVAQQAGGDGHPQPGGLGIGQGGAEIVGALLQLAIHARLGGPLLQGGPLQALGAQSTAQQPAHARFGPTLPVVLGHRRAADPSSAARCTSQRARADLPMPGGPSRRRPRGRPSPITA